MSSELGALLLADARLPTGGHAHSAGLEPALEAGLASALVPQYLTARLRTVGLVESAATVLAHRASRADPSRLSSVHEALLARTPSAPLRTASGLLGRGLFRLAARWAPEHPGVAALAALGRAPMRPVALGVVSAVLDMDESQAARASLYDDAQTVAAAALKLLPVDPAEATGWVLAAAPAIEEMVAQAVTVQDTSQMPALTAPQIEQWSLDHDTRTRRIFVA